MECKSKWCEVQGVLSTSLADLLCLLTIEVQYFCMRNEDY